MISYIPPQKRRKQKNLGLLSIFFITLVWFAFISIFNANLQSISANTLAVTKPAQQKTGTFIEWVNDLVNFSKIRNDYYRLKVKESKFDQSAGIMSIIKGENESLHRLLNSNTSKYNIIPAKILIGDLNGFDGGIIIDKGSNDDLKVGMNIILPENILVGRIVAIYPNYSKVESIYGNDTNISVVSLSENFLALLKKEVGGFLTIKFYPEKSKLNINDVFATSSENKDYIQGLLVGKIKDIKSTPLTTQKSIVLEPFFELPKLQNVFVITNYP